MMDLVEESLYPFENAVTSCITAHVCHSDSPHIDVAHCYHMCISMPQSCAYFSVASHDHTGLQLGISLDSDPGLGVETLYSTALWVTRYDCCKTTGVKLTEPFCHWHSRISLTLTKFMDIS